MKGLSYSFLIFGVLPFVFGCSNKIENKREDDDTTTQRVVLVDKYTCKIDLDTFKIADSDFHGLWQDSMAWDYQNGCWYGIKYIDKKLDLRFYASRKYIWDERFVNGDTAFYQRGEFWTYQMGDSNILMLAHNAAGDTFFQEGDTMYGTRYLIYKRQLSRILIKSIEQKPGDKMTKIIDLKRQ